MLQPKPNLLSKPSLSPRESTTQMTLRCDFYLFAIYGEIFLIVFLQTEVDYCSLKINILEDPYQYFLTIAGYGFVAHKYHRKKKKYI